MKKNNSKKNIFIDDNGYLSIEFSIVFSISIVLVLLIINISTNLYYRYIKICNESLNILVEYENNNLISKKGQYQLNNLNINNFNLFDIVNKYFEFYYIEKDIQNFSFQNISQTIIYEKIKKDIIDKNNFLKMENMNDE